jgi:perosamine synthetase
VFVDILPDSGGIDPALAEAAITPRTKAIIATHLYGNLCDMDRLLDIGRRHNIPVIEDAAEALGSQWHGKRAGSMGLFGVFSFHGTKTLTTGEGGMFVTNDPELHQRVLTLSNHGRERGGKQFWAVAVGFKYKLSDVQAAIGCAQLERIDELVGRRREILQYYRGVLAEHVGVSVNTEPPNTINGAWMPTAVFEPTTPVTREQLQTEFAAENVDARVFFHPLSSLPMFEACRHNRIAWSVPNRAINLPSYHDLTQSEQERVISVLLKCLQVTSDGLNQQTAPRSLRRDR